MKTKTIKKVTLKNPVVMLDLLIKEEETLNDAQEKLSCIETFTRDTFENFFCKYEECETSTDRDTLRIMLRNAQSYKKYLFVVIDYINQLTDRLSYTDSLIRETFAQLAEGEIHD